MSISYTYIIGTNLLTKFIEDRKINVASRVLTRKNAPSPVGHVFQPTGIIFELVQDIIGMDLLTKKNALPLGSHVFQANVTIFELIQDIIETNLLTKFHEDWTINWASRELKRQMLTPHNARPTKTHHEHAQNIFGTNLLANFHKDQTINVPPSGSHVFQPTSIIFELFQDIIRMNLLTKFHEDRTVNVACRVLTRFYYSHIRKKAPPLGSNTNLLTKFHEDWTINVVFREKCPTPGGNVCEATKTIFELIQDIIRTNLLTKFHDDRKINVTSRVLKLQPYKEKCPAPMVAISTINVASREKCPPLSSHVFQEKVTIFKLIQDIIGTNLLGKFHEDRKINVASRVLTRKNAPPLRRYIIGMNLLTRFHEGQTINVASREKNAPPHVFQANVTIFELIQDIIETNHLTKFHEDWTINVASRELTRQMLTAHDGQKAITKAVLR
ncbi:hypothetical protein DPMN_173657 [Dreissena polymorpha]|uniref:Uncharacterized protein n=1 Tax=Dreissena polymorpha TaxID=45954 RepID=A0A9D4E515_DREPO|nr:hypothetical protein DPMN_173657 [Dreissena polymorpha]